MGLSLTGFGCVVLDNGNVGDGDTGLTAPETGVCMWLRPAE